MHRSFLEAGADIICSNSYHASFEIFTAAGAFTDGVTLAWIPAANLRDSVPEVGAKAPGPTHRPRSTLR